MKRGAIVGFFTVTLALAGCTAQVGDLANLSTNREACPRGNANEMRDLQLHLIELGAHVSGKFEIVVINQASGVLASRIIYEPLQFGTRDVIIPNAVPPGSHFVDFYGDLSGDRMPTMPPADHTWRRPICDDGSLTFVHLAVFEDLDYGRPIGGGLRMTLDNIPPARRLGHLEVHVIARFPAGVNQTVGFYRYARVLPTGGIGPLESTEVIRIPGILDGGTEHTIYYFFDVDQNGVADSESGDLICMHDAIAGTDLDIALMVSLDVPREIGRGLCALDTLPAPDDPIPSL